MGKSTINGPCSIAVLNYQRVCVIIGWVKNYLSTIFGGINIQKAAIEESGARLLTHSHICRNLQKDRKVTPTLSHFNKEIHMVFVVVTWWYFWACNNIMWVCRWRKHPSKRNMWYPKCSCWCPNEFWKQLVKIRYKTHSLILTDQNCRWIGHAEKHLSYCWLYMITLHYNSLCLYLFI